MMSSGAVFTTVLGFIDWFGRVLILLWTVFMIARLRLDRRVRPDPAVVARLADEAERIHGRGASWVVGAQWNAYRVGRAARAGRDARHGLLLRAVAKELARRAAP